MSRVSRMRIAETISPFTRIAAVVMETASLALRPVLDQRIAQVGMAMRSSLASCWKW